MMGELALYLLFMLLCIIGGGLNISNAVTHFKKEHYTLLGFDIMFVIFEIILMINLICLH